MVIVKLMNLQVCLYFEEDWNEDVLSRCLVYYQCKPGNVDWFVAVGGRVTLCEQL